LGCDLAVSALVFMGSNVARALGAVIGHIRFLEEAPEQRWIEQPRIANTFEPCSKRTW
jgi:hypothetical protein